jgi:transcriptional regulator with XRE-family HTH domain
MQTVPRLFTLGRPRRTEGPVVGIFRGPGIRDQAHRLRIGSREIGVARDRSPSAKRVLSGIDQGDISRIERGSDMPDEKTLIRMADALSAYLMLVPRCEKRAGTGRRRSLEIQATMQILMGGSEPLSTISAGQGSAGALGDRL